MAPMNSSQFGSPSHGASQLPVTPTPEIQELYDELRIAEGEQEQHSRLSVRTSREMDNNAGTSLQLGGLSQGMIMSRSPSSASQASQSTKHGSAGIDDAGEDPRQDAQPKKRRAVRRRALGKVEKARAALVRKLGACPECRTRKVSVSAQTSQSTYWITPTCMLIPLAVHSLRPVAVKASIRCEARRAAEGVRCTTSPSQRASPCIYCPLGVQCR